MRGQLAALVIAAVTICTPASPAPLTQTCTIVPMVFFDTDKSNLTDKAQEVIAESARWIAHDHATHILVTGYCDAAEIVQGCAALALRRAHAVKAELVRVGMDEGMLEVRASEELLVPTGPNVREPQNRRAAIDWY